MDYDFARLKKKEMGTGGEQFQFANCETTLLSPPAGA
jgi:hypothetical protein